VGSAESPLRRPETLACLSLRVAAAMCFIGHGTFGVLTKQSWLPYFGAVGIGRERALALMPVVGAVDILLGALILVWPTKAVLAYMTAWAAWTALLRPLAHQGFSEFLERAGNYGVPLALLLLGRVALPRGGWLARLKEAPLDARAARRIALVLRGTTATLLLGHGALAAMGMGALPRHLAAIGLSPALGPAAAAGCFEIALALAVVVVPSWPVLLLALGWKVATEALYPATGDSLWEFVERGGSYGAPLASMILLRAAERGIPSSPQIRGFKGALPSGAVP